MDGTLCDSGCFKDCSQHIIIITILEEKVFERQRENQRGGEREREFTISKQSQKIWSN